MLKLDFKSFSRFDFNLIYFSVWWWFTHLWNGKKASALDLTRKNGICASYHHFFKTFISFSAFVSLKSHWSCFFLSVSSLFIFSVYPPFHFFLSVFFYRFLDLHFAFALLSSKVRFHLITVGRYSLTRVNFFPFNKLGYTSVYVAFAYLKITLIRKCRV